MKNFLFTLIMLLVGWLPTQANILHVPSATYPTIVSAITAASNGDTIQFLAITMTERSITVNKSLTFIGAGQNSTIIQAHATPGAFQGRIFNIYPGVSVRFEKMTLRHGSAPGNGGCINSINSHFSLEEVTFKDNETRVSSHSGGAIYAIGSFGGLDNEIKNCVFEGNKTENIGGAIFVGGAAGFTQFLIDSCQFINNMATGAGGAIFQTQNVIRLQLSNSSFIQNQANSGGALKISNFSMRSCTFEQNQSTSSGGAVLANGLNSSSVSNCTFVNNTGEIGGGISTQIENPGSLELINNTLIANSSTLGLGGNMAIRNLSNRTGPVHLINNIVADASSGTDLFIDGLIGTNNNNLVESCSSAGAGLCPTFSYTNLTGLGTFANHGGFTKTYSLTSSSNAVNAGTSTGAPATDQRGVLRNIGAPDLGAYEFVPPLIATCQAVTANLDASGHASIAASDLDGGTTGGIPTYSYQASQTAFSCADKGANAVTLTVTDGAGSMATCSATVFVPSPAQLAPQNCGSCSQIRFDFCEGEDSPDLEALLMNNTNFVYGASFLWYADNSGSQGSPISSPSPNMATKNTRFYWVSQFSDGCEGDARRVRVRVRKTSTVVLDLPVIGCGGSQVDLAAWVSDSRNFATGYTFYDSDPAIGNPTALGSVSATKGNANNGQYMIINLPGTPKTYYATASNSTGCQVTGSNQIQSAFGANLDPISDITVNSGSSVNVAFSSPNATHIFWFDHSSFNNPNIGIMGSFGMGNLTFTASNPFAQQISATIRVVPYNGNCAGDAQDFIIKINPGSQTRQASNSIALQASKLNVHDVQISWEIQSEYEMQTIEVEKLKNDGEWVAINQQAADQHGVGTHHDVSLRDGSYLDRGGMGNVTKYRLKLSFVDGRAVWSRAVEVNFDFYNNKHFTLYPNPSDGRFFLRSASELEGNWQYQLSDPMGRLLRTGELQANNTGFNISEQPAGHYHLLIVSPEGKRYVHKIVKE